MGGALLGGVGTTPAHPAERSAPPEAPRRLAKAQAARSCVDRSATTSTSACPSCLRRHGGCIGRPGGMV